MNAFQRLRAILLLHNNRLTAEAIIEIADFLIPKFGLDQTSIWELDEEYVQDLVAGG